jgi:hypothetical protein
MDIAPTAFLHHIFASWTDNNFGQRVSGSSISYLPMTILYTILHVLGSSILTTQRIWFTLLLSVAALGMSSFYARWWNDSSDVRPLLAGLLYALNPYVLLNLKGATSLLISYAVLPIVCRQIVLVIRKPSFGNLLIVGVTGGILMAGVNPPIYAIAFTAVLLVGITEVVRLRFSRRSLRGFTLALASIAICCLWWLEPFVNGIRSGGSSAYFVTDPLSLGSSFSSFVQVLRLAGLWALNQGWHGVPYYPSQAFLLSRPVVALSLLAPLGVLVWITFRWNDLRARALTAAIVLAVFMAVAIYPVSHPSPSGELYQWLWNHFYIFRAFRNPDKWDGLLAFVYALVLPNLARKSTAAPTPMPIRDGSVQVRGFHRDQISRYLNRHSIYGSALVAILIAIYSIPFADNLVFPSNYYIGSVPAYWHQAATWLNAQPDNGRVLFLPNQGFSIYNWGTPESDVASLFLNRPEITSGIGVAFPASVQSLLNLFENPGQNQNWSLVLSELGIQYVVQRNDANWQFYNSPSPASMKVFLSSIASLRHVKSFGKLDIYAVRGGGHSQVGAARELLTTVADSSGNSPPTNASSHSDLLTSNASAAIVNPLITSEQASSTWSNLTTQYGPQQVIDADRSTAWVSNVPYAVGEWVQLNFAKSIALSTVTVFARQDGLDALPTELRISAGGYSEDVAVNGKGIAVARLTNYRARDLRVTIMSSGIGGPNVGISTINIAGLPGSEIQYPAISSTNSSADEMTFASLGFQSLPHVLSSKTTMRARFTGAAQVSNQESDSTLARYLKPLGVTRVFASSRWSNEAQFSPLWTIAGDLNIASIGSYYAWVSAVPGGVGQWIQFNFPKKRFVGNVILTGRNDGVDAEATQISLSDGSRIIGRRNLSWQSNGTANVYVGAPISSLRITILASQKNRPSDNVGFRHIAISGVSVNRDMSAIGTALTIVDHHGTVSGPKRSYSTPIRFSSSQEADAYAVGLGSVSINDVVQLYEGRNYLSVSSEPLNQVASLDLVTGNPNRAKITWLDAVHTFGVGSYSAKITKGYKYLLLNDSPDAFWRASLSGLPLRQASAPSNFGPIWMMPNSAGTIQLQYESGPSTEIWLIIWGAFVVSILIVGGIATYLARRYRSVRLES